MTHLKLHIKARTADGLVPVTLTADKDYQDSVKVSDLHAAEAVHNQLNDKNNRRQAEDLGLHLFGWLFRAGGELRTCWDQLSDDDKGLPLELVIDDEQLRIYPWELLRDPSALMPARNGGVVRRSATLSPLANAKTAAWPLRILVIVGSADATIGAKAELAALKRECIEFGRSLDIRPLLLPKADTLRTALKDYQPNVIHFIGHGTKVDGTDCLLIETTQSAWSWDTVMIAEDLRNARCTPAFVFLNCCRSAGDRDSNLSIQLAFSGRSAIVLAMQADVRGDLAARFSRAFYRKTVVEETAGEFATVLGSVNAARRELGDHADLDWALPSLTFARDLALGFVLRTPWKWPDDLPFSRCQEFEDAKIFANCSDERRTMVHWHYPINPEDDSQSKVLIVHGPASSGRSHLVRWCMESWALNYRVRYLRASGVGGLNCVKLLILLRRGEMSVGKDEERLLHEGLDLETFKPFYQGVAKRIDWPDGTSDLDEKIRLIDAFEHEVHDNVDPRDVCEAFLAGLKQLGKVVLVLDQLDGMDKTLAAPFREHVVLPLAKDDKSAARLVLVVNDTQYKGWGLDVLRAQHISLRTDQTNDELIELALEACRHQEEDFVRKFSEMYLLKQDPKQGGQGMARLHFCKTFFADILAKYSLGRMR